MKKRLLLVLPLLLAVGLAASLLLLDTPEHKNFGGRPLEDWCVQAYRGDSNAVAELKLIGTNAIPGLVRLLRARDSIFRRQLWSALPKLPRRARATVVQRVAPPTAEVVREAAGHALGLLGTEAARATPALARALRDREGRVRQEAAGALARIGEPAVGDLIAALADPNAVVRQAAAHALGQIGPAAEAAVPDLVARLNDADEHVRNISASSLVMIGTSGVLALVDVAQHGEANSREAAVKRLGQRFLPLHAATTGFMQMAKNESPAQRRRAIEALALIPAAEGLLTAIAFDALTDPAADVRVAAVKALGAMGPRVEGAVPALKTHLGDQSPEVREWTAWALGKIGPGAKGALPELNKLTGDEAAAVRLAAQEAIALIARVKPAD